MSIIITSMSMPARGCMHCFFREGNYCSQLPDVAAGEILQCASGQKRHKKCPLREYENKEEKR